ncbi:MAG: PSD1 and planctomycete cytochrome C domain-containing protein [Bryobacteraceae bacterium]
MKKLTIGFMVVIGLLWSQQKNAPATRLEEEARAILAESCASCHGPENPAGKLRLDSLEVLTLGGASGAALIPGDSAASRLIERVTTTDRALRMPPAGAPLPEEKIAVLSAWIDRGASGVPRIDFARDVKPILEANCLGCHGGKAPKSQLRLDVRSMALKGGLGGKVLLPGDSEGSRLIHRIEGRGEEQRMPLGMPALSDEQIATIRRWIDAGAAWPDSESAEADAAIETHWAYRKPVRPAIPQVKASAQARNPIDAFVLARLEQEGLTFSPEASKETLLRRLSLDLIGLPPTPQEIDEFVADTRPDAYERVVDRLLASPHYGERWARPWLDLARYADTHGFEKDRRRSIWKFRDWVIDALNADMPFDQFTIEQIAGDLLPNATDAQKIATGFHRNTMYNEEGGVDKDEAHFEVLVDRVNTTATVWLGSTIGCAQCHNHKYDPFTQKEYYQLMAFFNSSTKELQAYGDTSTKYREPELDLATPEQEAAREELRARIKELETKLKTPTKALKREQTAWEKSVLKSSEEWRTLKPERLHAEAGTTLEARSGGAIFASGENPQRETYVVEGKLKLPALSGVRIEALPDEKLPRGGPGRDIYGNFILSAVKVEVAPAGAPESWREIRFESILSDDGRINDRRNRALWTVDASREDNRVPRQLVLANDRPVPLNGEALIRITIVSNSEFVGQSMGQFRLSVTDSKKPEHVVSVRALLRPALEVQRRSKEQEEKLSEFFRTIAPSLESARNELKDLRLRLERLNIISTLVMAENDRVEHPSDHVRTRGGFASKAEKVYANVPAILNGLAEGVAPNRLALARWLVSPENPLTARVTVNRIWEQYFGRGIVETTEDFGSQGALPTHAELLDWLAVEFMERGWSQKAIHRLIVTSTTYRQSSRITPELLRGDPYNRLLARGPRFRMEAEMIRDTALAAGGLLSRKIGGPSVFPPQPPGVWDIPYSDDAWIESTGEDRYRRGLYTFLRRSAPYPAFINFDATSREFCTVRRIRTNTPIQALTTLNDEAFFEAAQALARRIVAEGGAQDSARIRFGFRLAAGRPPGGSELDRIATWMNGERSYFRSYPDEAKKIAPNADDPVELAAWTMFGNVLLNLDETLTKE